jgi:hypothetical protein
MRHHRNARRFAQRSRHHNVLVSTRKKREHFGEGQNFRPSGSRGAPESLRHLIILARNQPRVLADDDKIGVVRNILRRIRRSARKFFTSQHLRDRRIDGFVGACYGNAAVAQQDSCGAHAHAGKADKVGFTKWKCGHCRFVWKLRDHAPPNSSNQSGTWLRTPALCQRPQQQGMCAPSPDAAKGWRRPPRRRTKPESSCSSSHPIGSDGRIVTARDVHRAFARLPAYGRSAQIVVVPRHNEGMESEAEYLWFCNK